MRKKEQTRQSRKKNQFSQTVEAHKLKNKVKNYEIFQNSP